MTSRPPTETERQIAALRAQCTPEEQETFAALYAAALDDALATAQAAATPLDPIDPDVVELERLAMLEQRARGEAGGADEAAGLCYVPLPQGRLYRFTPPATLAETTDPTNDVQEAHPMAPPSSRMRWAVALTVSASSLLLFLVWRDPAPLLPAHAAQEAAGGAPPAASLVTTPPLTATAVHDIRNRDASPTDPTTLEISGTARLVWPIVPSRSELGGVWRPPLMAGTAARLQDSVVNPVLCLPSEDAAFIERLTRGTPLWLRLASGAVRPYEVLSVERVGRQHTEVLTQRDARLTIIVCGLGGNERIVATALYRPQLDGLPPLPDAQEAVIPQWVSAAYQGIDLTPTGDRVRVTLTMRLTNRSERPLPLTDLLDQLVIEGEAMPALVRPHSAPLAPDEPRDVTFAYLVPTISQSTQAVWHLVTPDGQRADVLIDLSQP